MIEPDRCSLHHPARVLGDEEIAENIDVHHRAPFLRVGLGDRLGDQDAGVGDNDVDMAEVPFRVDEQLLHFGFAGDVNLRADDARAGRLRDHGRRLLGALFVDVGDDDDAALVRQALADRPAETLRAARHDGDLVGERPSHGLANLLSNAASAAALQWPLSSGVAPPRSSSAVSLRSRQDG